MDERDIAREKARRTQDVTDWNNFRRLRNRCTKTPVLGQKTI